MRSFEDRFAEVGGFGPGFDALRLVLCYEVVVWHAWTIGAGSPLPGKASLFWIPFETMVPMFFALSGFLVAGSAVRLNVRQFMLSRSLRILPALAAVVGLSALVIGPMMTDRGLLAYVGDQRFITYFLNVVGVVRYTLPGVFTDSPLGPAVNGSLWTVPWEITCYLIMATLMAAGQLKRWWLLMVVALLWLCVATIYAFTAQGQEPQLIHKLLRFGLTTQGALLIPYFLGGAGFYLARRHIPFDGRIAAVIIAMLVATSLLVDGLTWSKSPVLALLMLFPCVYLVAWLGLLKLPRPPGFRSGDYSYGVYLCHFPILQAMQASFAFSHWGWLLLASLLPVTLFAASSWHMIEAPMLAQRKRFSLLGRRLAGELNPPAAP
ncbi:acyltransferase [Sandarakinorhabdus sp.]|uniref:acyltransferase family protein n=1 Tax=Sandarakinorhabdus sp. TaxID=1916663 RepID=UPI00286DE299|nr:acyltransferase [Sandarakinorhabdus sp.]